MVSTNQALGTFLFLTIQPSNSANPFLELAKVRLATVFLNALLVHGPEVGLEGAFVYINSDAVTNDFFHYKSWLKNWFTNTLKPFGRLHSRLIQDRNTDENVLWYCSILTKENETGDSFETISSKTYLAQNVLTRLAF